MFFPDILNTCGAIHGICELSNVAQLKAEMLKELTGASGRLIEQIISHRDFTLTEKHELPVYSVRVDCLSVLEEH